MRRREAIASEQASVMFLERATGQWGKHGRDWLRCGSLISGRALIVEAPAGRAAAARRTKPHFVAKRNVVGEHTPILAQAHVRMLLQTSKDSHYALAQRISSFDISDTHSRLCAPSHPASRPRVFTTFPKAPLAASRSRLPAPVSSSQTFNDGTNHQSPHSSRSRDWQPRALTSFFLDSTLASLLLSALPTLGQSIHSARDASSHAIRA